MSVRACQTETLVVLSVFLCDAGPAEIGMRAHSASVLGTSWNSLFCLLNYWAFLDWFGESGCLGRWTFPAVCRIVLSLRQQHLNASRIRFALFSLSSIFLFFVLFVWSCDVPGMSKCFARSKQKAVRKEMTHQQKIARAHSNTCLCRENEQQAEATFLLRSLITRYFIAR